MFKLYFALFCNVSFIDFAILLFFYKIRSNDPSGEMCYDKIDSNKY